MAKDGSLTGQALADYQAAWNKQNGANYDYSRAVQGGGQGGTIQVLQAPSGYQSSSSPIGASFSTGSGSGGGGTALTNSAQADPNLQDYLSQIKARTQGPGTLPANLQLLGQGIGELAEGGRNSLRNDLSRRGMLGNSGAEGGLGAEIVNKGIAEYAKQGRQAVVAREGQVDNLLQGAAGAYAAPGQQQLAEKGLNLSQYNSQQQAALQQQAMAQSAAQQAFQNQIAAQNLAMQQRQQTANLYNGLYREGLNVY